MKKVIGLLLCLLVAGCGSMTVETSTSQRTDAKGALLFEVAEGLSVGPVATWERWTDLDDSGPEPTGAGVRVKMSASWIGGLDDTGAPAPWPFPALEGITLVPYGTIEWLDYAENDNVSNLQPQYGLGTEASLGGGLLLFTEYSTGDAQPDDVSVGVAYRFGF